MTREKLKVVTIVGTRPEIIKLSRVLAELDRHTRHVLVHTGQNYDYELNGIFFADLGIRQPDHYLDVASASVAETIAAIIVRCDLILDEEKPDAVLFYGDTNSCLAVIAAKRRKIPVFHMEAGNRSFDERVPEEINRRLIDDLSDVNMTNSEHARRYLLAEGKRPELVLKTGSPMREVLEHILPTLDPAAVLEGLNLSPQNYFLVSCHREENVDDDRLLGALVDCLADLRQRHDVPVIVTTHPRTRQRLEQLASGYATSGVVWSKPFGYRAYLALQMQAKCVISDSGTITEEASLLGFPAVMVRDAHERPEGVDAGVLPFVSLGEGRLAEAVEMVLLQATERPAPRLVPDYSAERVSQAVARILLSYTGYVNRVIWRRTDG